MTTLSEYGVAARHNGEADWNKLIVRLVTLPLLYAATVGNMLFAAFLAVKFIRWFIVPTFPAAAAITMPVCFGVSFLIDIAVILRTPVTGKANTDKPRPWATTIARTFVLLILWGLVALFAAIVL